MIAVTVKDDSTTLANAFNDLRRKYPKEVVNALKRIKNGLRKHSKEAISSGSSAALKLNFGWPRKSGISLRLRPTPAFGGKLATSIRAFNDKRKVTLGWPEGLRMWGESFQSAQTRSFTGRERAWMKSRGVSAERLDRGYDRPAREVWNPLINGAGTQSYIIGTVVDHLDRLNKRVEREAMARRRTRARIARSARRVVKRTRRVTVSGVRNVRRAGRIVSKQTRRTIRNVRRAVRAR